MVHLGVPFGSCSPLAHPCQAHLWHKMAAQVPVLPLLEEGHEWEMARRDGRDVWEELQLIAKSEYRTWYAQRLKEWGREDQECWAACGGYDFWAAFGEAERVAEIRDRAVRTKKAELRAKVEAAFWWWWGEEKQKVREERRLRRLGEV